jgi:hypothetical protein
VATGSGIVSSAKPADAVPTGGGGSSNTAFGLAALIGAGGVALVRLRTLSGVDDVGTLTALGHSAATFWAGSCYSLGAGASTTAVGANVALTTEAITPASVLGGRARFGVEGVLSGAEDVGGRILPPAASLAGDAAGEDRTRLVALLFAAAAAIGAALGALAPRGRASRAHSR